VAAGLRVRRVDAYAQPHLLFYSLRDEGYVVFGPLKCRREVKLYGNLVVREVAVEQVLERR
jgi:hypothetical protein